MNPERRTRALKVLISIFVLYHLGTVLLMPIGSSLVGRQLARYFLPYANTFGFNTTWQFFSPGPSPMFYLEYEPDFGPDAASFEGEPKYFPPRRPGLQWSDAFNRRLFSMRFLSMNPMMMDRFLVPYLCRLEPGAKAIDVRSIVDQVEPIDRPMDSSEFREMTERIDLPRQKYSCPEEEA